MTNDRRGAIKKLRSLIYTPKTEAENFRKRIDQYFSTVFMPNHVERTETYIDSIPCDILTPEVYGTERTMLYIHGGSFVGGSRASWRGFCASLAHASSTRVILPEFRLAPTFAYPAALEDAKRVLKSLYADESQLIIAADGAGASIALALALCLKGAARHKIDQIVLLSPWLDISSESSILKMKKCRDVILSPEAIRHCGNMYTYESNLTNPLVSPLYAPVSMLEDFPEVYIQMGSEEALLPDAQRFCTLLKEAGIPNTLDIWPDMMHLFQFADEYLNEAHLAVNKIGKFIQEFRSRYGDSEESDNTEETE